MMRRFLIRLLLAVVLLFAVSTGTFAQCALCKSTAESSLKEGSTHAKGLNTGILYLLVMPYILVGGIGYWWYTQRKKQSEAGTEV